MYAGVQLSLFLNRMMQNLIPLNMLSYHYSFMYLFGDQQPSACTPGPSSWPATNGCTGNRVSFKWKEVDCGIQDGAATASVGFGDNYDEQVVLAKIHQASSSVEESSPWQQCYNTPCSYTANPEDPQRAKFLAACPNHDASLSSVDCPTKDSSFTYGTKWACALGASAEYFDNNEYLWNTEKQTCYLHGNYGHQASCMSGDTSTETSQLMEEYNAKIGSMAKVTVDGETVDAMIGVGHGVLDAKCGDCYALRFKAEGATDYKYAVILTEGVDAWSLEISNEVNNYIGQKNLGDLAQVPGVVLLDSDTCVSIPKNAKSLASFQFSRSQTSI